MNKEDCVHCKESKLNIGEKTNYGAVIIYKDSNEKNGWYATLSPKTIGNPNKDFSIQLMPRLHLKHISDISSNYTAAKNYGIAFSKLSKAMTILMKEENRHNENNEDVVRIGTYGKSKHPEEHFHIKLFPWQFSYVVDKTYENILSYKDEKTGEEFIKMEPIKKKKISEDRLNLLSKRFIELLRQK